MRLSITHRTTHSYDEPVSYGLQQIRMVPKSRGGQAIINWDITLEGARREATFDDQHNNVVWLTSMDEGATEISLICQGEVENTNGSGIIGTHGGYAPLWYFGKTTRLTEPGNAVTRLADAVAKNSDHLDRLHSLSARIASDVAYEVGSTGPNTSAEEALAGSRGVCQDHSHIMIAAARLLGHPARYVSGYLMMNDRIDQDATHAWAEVHVEGIGWVGFDVSNGHSPDERYVRVATGLDYAEAAPISGLRVGSGATANETMRVSIQVQQ
ncbi:MAG: transglutaminase family protein [Ahrensia sp.]|nr:transglutaminase family protein [Ahrensia sp.]